MRLRSDWQTTKAAAKKANNNVEVKFPAKADLGPLLDKYATAQKAYAKAKGNEHNAAWAKTAAAYFAAAVAVGSAARPTAPSPAGPPARTAAAPDGWPGSV